MNYNDANEKLQGRNSQTRKLANNTYLVRNGNDIAIRLHSTNVVTFKPNGDIVLNSGGWHTPTTKDRINGYLSGYRIGQDKGVWYLHRWGSGSKAEILGRFQDGLTIHANGSIDGIVKDTPKANKADNTFKRRVKAYADLCAQAVPLDKPGNGDCWYCLMQTDKGETLGDATKNTEHLDSHMAESYIVPSLVMNAIKAHYNAPMAFWQAFKDTGWTSEDRPFGKQAVRKAVYRYIMRRFGFAS